MKTKNVKLPKKLLGMKRHGNDTSASYSVCEGIEIFVERLDLYHKVDPLRNSRYSKPTYRVYPPTVSASTLWSSDCTPDELKGIVRMLLVRIHLMLSERALMFSSQATAVKNVLDK